MMIEKIWANGTAVQIENESYSILKETNGNGTVFRGHGREWFHFSIPTPRYPTMGPLGFLHPPLNLILGFWVFYKTEGSAKITRIDLYDGNKGFAIFKDMALWGDHSRHGDDSNWWQIYDLQHNMYNSLGISVLVDFGFPAPNKVPGIWFTGAGAEILCTEPENYLQA